MNIPRHFFSQAQKLRSKGALLYKDPDTSQWQDITWTDFALRVKNLAAYLFSMGVKKGDRVALVSENRPEWAISDLAILSTGAIAVPVYFTNTSSQIDYILKDSGANVVLVSTREQLEKVMDGEYFARLKKVITFDPLDRAVEGNVLPLSDVDRLAKGLDKDHINAIIEEIKDNDVASILYTSGTTGPPKGVVLTHENLLSNVLAIKEVIEVTADDLFLSFLPLSHAFERTVGFYVPLLSGSTIAYAESIENIPLNMREVKPTIIIGVPRFYEKTYAAIREAVNKGSAIKKSLFRWALGVGKSCADLRESKEGPPAVLQIQKNIAEALVLEKVKSRVGGRLRFFVSGGAPLSYPIQEFFNSLGLIILEGYGLTETSPVMACNTLENRRMGTVGKALPGVEIKIAPDGEIITRGPNLMQGYYKKKAVTKEVIKDGWFHTGDIGTIDDDGFLRITDRKKDIIVTSGGKNVAPQNIETTLLADTLISQAMVYGDRRKYLTALIVPDMEALEKVATSKGIQYSSLEALIDSDEIYQLYMDRIEGRLKDFARYERIKKFALLKKELTIDAGEITPTLKIKRKVVVEKYKAILDSMYEGDSNNPSCRT